MGGISPTKCRGEREEASPLIRGREIQLDSIPVRAVPEQASDEASFGLIDPPALH